MLTGASAACVLIDLGTARAVGDAFSESSIFSLNEPRVASAGYDLVCLGATLAMLQLELFVEEGVTTRATLLEAVRRDLLNDRMWPDFFALSTPGDRFLTATTIEPLVTVERAGLRITPVPVSHCTETLAMVVDDGTSCVAFAADTGPTELLWSHLADRTNVRAVFLECSFPESLERLATACGHLSPTTFATQVARLARGVRTLVVHRKAAHTATIAAELAARALPGVELAEAGPIYDL